jgi:hypothetical protein
MEGADFTFERPEHQFVDDSLLCSYPESNSGMRYGLRGDIAESKEERCMSASSQMIHHSYFVNFIAIFWGRHSDSFDFLAFKTFCYDSLPTFHAYLCNTAV